MSVATANRPNLAAPGRRSRSGRSLQLKIILMFQTWRNFLLTHCCVGFDRLLPVPVPLQPDPSFLFTTTTSAAPAWTRFEMQKSFFKQSVAKRKKNPIRTKKRLKRETPRSYFISFHCWLKKLDSNENVAAWSSWAEVAASWQQPRYFVSTTEGVSALKETDEQQR